MALMIISISTLIFLNYFVRGDSVNFFLIKDLVFNTILFVGLPAVLISRNEPMSKFIFQSYLPEIVTSVSQPFSSFRLRMPELRLPDFRGIKVAVAPSTNQDLHNTNIPMTS